MGYTFCNISTLQLSTNPTRLYRCFARSSPVSSLFLATFCVRRLRLHLWNVCSLRMDCSCVQIGHACPTLCWKLCSSLNTTVLFVCDVAQCNCRELATGRTPEISISRQAQLFRLSSQRLLVWHKRKDLDRVPTPLK